MKLLSLPFIFGLIMTSAAAQADGALAEKKNCLGCHAVAERRVGPAFKQIAAKYAGQPGAVDQLTQKIIKGGAGNWGAVPMPANNQVTPAEARQLVLWVLSQK